MNSPLEHKRIVIIGGTSGMGLGAAKSAIEAGASVTVGSSSSARLEAALRELGDQAKGAQVDVRDSESVRGFIATVGKFDHLLFTAAPGDTGPFLEQPIEEARRYLDGHLWGSYSAARYAAPKLNDGGTITFLSGGYHKRPAPGRTMIVVSQAAIEGLMRALAVELSPIRVNVIVPGLIDTPLWQGMPDEQREGMFANEAARLPAKRVGVPSDIGDGFVYLATNSFVTGSALTVNGGFHLV